MNILQQTSAPTQSVFFSKVIGFFALAILISAAGVLSGFFVIPQEIVMNRGFYFLAFIIELGLIFTSRTWSQKLPLGYFLFVLFAFLSGLTAVPILGLAGMIGGAELIGKALLATFATFGAAAVFGVTTGKNLVGLGGWLSMSIIGMIIISVAGFFFPWGNTFELILAGFGVIVFSAYTAYDFQKIKGNHHESEAIAAAIALYLDIFNLFIFILRLMIAFRSD